MKKKVFIAEKPSVANEFANVIGIKKKYNGYYEDKDIVITWCVGHLITMSYPEKYDAKYKKWNIFDLPFIPDKYKYEVIAGVRQQFLVIKKILMDENVESIYVCTDSGREGEYIYRLIDSFCHVPSTVEKKRVWIDSQTNEAIKNGISSAKPLSSYDNLAKSAYLRAIEDYLIGINFSRIYTLKYAGKLNECLKTKKWIPISIGRVMTCTLGIIVKREEEIRNFKKTIYYKIIGDFEGIEAEWQYNDESLFKDINYLYNNNGILDENIANNFIDKLGKYENGIVKEVKKKTEKNNAPLLFNLAELQNTASKLFKISPDETLGVVQELYEKKLVTYPRTDSRHLSTAVAKEITKNIKGMTDFELLKKEAEYILENSLQSKLVKSKYVNDSKITDHYAIIPTGSAISNINKLGELQLKVYELISRRFLSIFYPPMVKQKYNLIIEVDKELFTSSFSDVVDEGWRAVSKLSFIKNDSTPEKDNKLKNLKKGQKLNIDGFRLTKSETSPPSRYNSGSIILAMENAGQFIEDESLREQIKGSGIGTSATRAEILSKLIRIGYIKLNKKTQILTPSLLGEMVYQIIDSSLSNLLNPKFTASWEKGLSMISDGEIEYREYDEKLRSYIKYSIDKLKKTNNTSVIDSSYKRLINYYKK